MEYNLFNPNQHSRKPIILFASQPYVHGAFASSGKRIKSISKIYFELNKVSKIADVIVKPHPNENSSDLKKISNFSANFVLSNNNISINNLIDQCDIFITMSSTSALYSMCAGKPVIIVNLENTVNYSEYKNSNAVWEANSSLELRKLLIDHLMNKIPKHDL